MPSPEHEPHEEVAVLAVDDVPENLVALAALLKRPGLRLFEARSGNEALEALLEHDFALALVDVNMPGMDGFELAELMRGSQRTREVPIIFLTAAVPEAGRVFQGYEAGAVDFLIKPFHPHLLVSKVEVFAQLHRQKRQLARQLEQLRQAQAMSDLFVGVLGHDLRNPLNNVLLSASALEAAPADPATVLSRARIIQRASFRMQRLIEQVLSFALARVKGGIPIQLATADLADLTRQLVADLEAPAAARIQLELVGDTNGRWDPDRLSQLVSNLLGNALQHGEREAPILVRIDGTDAESVLLEVHNGGVVPDTARADLFSPFKHRGQKSNGVGLGLFIVSQIVQAHGGHIALRSSQEDGTIFAVRVPRTAPCSLAAIPQPEMEES